MAPYTIRKKASSTPKGWGLIRGGGYILRWRSNVDNHTMYKVKRVNTQHGSINQQNNTPCTKKKTIMLNEHSNTVNKLETGGPRLYMCVSYTPWACLPLKSRLTRLLHCYRRIDGFTAIWKLRCFGMSNESLNRAIVTCNQSVTQN